MNIKDIENPYEDTRKRDENLKIANLIKKKAVYKTNYELVTGIPPAKISNINKTPKSFILTRSSGATLNGRTL
jgi:hypothetical protein